jgi:hypothetical protein
VLATADDSASTGVGAILSQEEEQHNDEEVL